MVWSYLRMPLFICFFEYLECRPVWGFHVIDTVFDDYIPFCEYFIVPYLLWFPYQILTVLYFIFRTRIKKNIISWFSIWWWVWLFSDRVLCISKCTALKTIRVSKENVFTDMVRWLYRTDTPTNVLPSIHVFNSLAVHMSLTNCEALRDHKGVRYGSLVLTLLIIMSTMFWSSIP